jgi:O-antigen ligase
MRITGALLLATLFCITFEKIHWNVAGDVGLADVLTILFLAAFLLGFRPHRLPRTTAVVIVFFAAFLLVYLLGFFNLGTREALDQFAKGLVKFVLHFGLLAAGVAYLARRSRTFYWRSLAALALGLVVNGVYGVLQLLAARAGHNLDSLFIEPITGGASAINVYGAVNGASVFRPNALTGDPNHLAIELDVPLLALTPLYLRLERGHRLRAPLAAALAFLLLVELLTLSRSGLLGLAVGALVLTLPYRRRLVSRALLVPLGALAVVLAAVIWERRHYVEVVIRSRTRTSGSGGTSTHFAVYDFIPQILHSHPLLGLGLNNFSVYYEFVTGKTNWGPHSFYVALIVETGLVGAILFGAFLWWVFVRLGVARRLARTLRDVRMRSLAWGFTAALLGTMAANAFYLTMQFYYFYGFLALALTLPLVVTRRGSAAAFPAPEPRPPR